MTSNEGSAETQRSCSGLCRGPGISDDCEYFQHEQPTAPAALLDFVRLVETKNREMAALMRRNKIKITDTSDPMQKLAFTFYTEIGELAHKAGVLLVEHEAALLRGEQQPKEPLDVVIEKIRNMTLAKGIRAKTARQIILEWCLEAARSRPHPAPARSGCDGCRKETEHLECPMPGHCDQMKCPICCEGSDFPTLPEEIKKYEAAAARAAREERSQQIRDFVASNPLDGSCPFGKMNSDECLNIRDGQCEVCVVDHAIESLRGERR